MGAVASQIFLQRMHFGPFYVYSIVPCPTTPPIWQMFQALLVYFDHMNIWKVFGCWNSGQIPFLLFWQPISEWYFWAWKYDMLAKMQCLCSGGKNKVKMRDQDPWFLPYWYEMDDLVGLWCTMLVLEPKYKLFIILLFKVVPYSNNQTPLENLWDNNGTNQNYFSQVMMNHQGW